MIRTQIQLTEEQSRRLHGAAQRSGTSMAEVIRKSVDAYLERESGMAISSPTREDAAQVAGVFRSGRSDVGARHDDYLDEAYAG